MAFLRAFLVIIGILCLSATSWGAEVAKLRQVISVYNDNKGVALRHPEGVGCNGNTIVIGDTENNRLVRYTLQAKELKGGTEIKVPQLSVPARVQINSKGEIFALDAKQRRIVRLSPDGAFKGYVVAEGAPSQSTVVPKSFKIGADDAIYILDIFTGRVLVLSPDGKYQRQIDFPKEYGFFSDLAVDPRGSILLIDCVKAQVFAAARSGTAFSPLGGSIKEYISFPVALTTDSRGTIYVVDDEGAVGVLSPDGSFLGKQLGMGRSEAFLYFPSQICINGNGDTFIADGGNDRIQVFSLAK